MHAFYKNKYSSGIDKKGSSNEELMKAITFIRAAGLLGLLFTQAAWSAAADLKTISCMFELQAEAYRFLRLQQQTMQASSNPVQVGKLKSQIKASAQELFQNVREARSGMVGAGLQNQYKLMEDVVSDFVSDAIVPSDSQDVGGLRFKQNVLVRLAAESAQALEQKLGNPATRKLALIGRTKVGVERFAYDFEMCKLHCEQVLAGELADLEQALEDMRHSLARHFSQHSYELAMNQMVFMRLSVDRRAQSSSMETAQHNLIVASGHLWELIDAVLESYTQAGGE